MEINQPNAGITSAVTSVDMSGRSTGLTSTSGPITGAGSMTLGGMLAVANGGTGVTTSTGTGSVVLSTSPTITTPIIVGGKFLVPIFDHFTDVGNVTTGETDLYSDTLAAGQLTANGDKVESEYGGTFVSSGTATRQIRAYFGGTMVFDTGTLTVSLAAAWTMYLTTIRVSASVVRCMVSLTTEGAALAAYTSYTEVTGLTLANTQILKITGQAGGVGAATNDIVAKMGSVTYLPKA